jgi:hypothetical protein
MDFNMKAVLLLTLILLLFSNTILSQGGCPSNIKIQTPAVPKPASTSLVSATCSTLVVKWDGSAGQTYLVSGIVKDPATHQTTATIPANNITCDGSLSCTATIPVEAGTTVTWSVQAQQEINGRNFYSYQLRAEQDYLIAACAAPERVSAKRPLGAEATAAKMYPNPVETFLTIDFKSPAKQAIITISDINGRTVMKKANPENRQLNVGNLSSGLYLLKVTDSNGKVLYNARFIKR